MRSFRSWLALSNGLVLLLLCLWWLQRALYQGHQRLVAQTLIALESC